MHTLVTGGGGFLGRYICEMLLARGDKVRSFSRGAYPDLEKLGVEVVRGDIKNRSEVYTACEDIDCVFHAASNPGVGMRWKEYQKVNFHGTMNVVYACLEKKVSRLVYTSSPSVVFAGEDHEGVDESIPYGTDWLELHRGHYSRTKAAAEEFVLLFNKVPDLNTCALRPHLIWGPRDQHLIPRLIARAKSGRLRRVGEGKNLVDMIYVENAAQAHLQAADALATEDSPVAGNAYFLSQGEPVNCWQWIDEILALADLPPVQKSIPLKTAWKVGKAFEFVYRTLNLKSEPPMTRFLAAQLATSHWFDISAARRDFGYEPQISTEEGMKRLGNWLRDNA